MELAEVELTERKARRTSAAKPTFIALFAGCGGLLLGLLKAGLSGVLAIEKDPLAFKTFEHNLIGPETYPKFDWPPWFPKKPHTVADFNVRFGQQIQSLRGNVTLVVGGCPCQGFSLAGRREHFDERNSLFQDFLDTVAILSPALVILENVHAITMPFVRSEGTCGNRVSVADEIKAALEAAGYKVFSELVKFQEFGVPQRRSRYFIAGVKNRLIKDGFDLMSPFSIMTELRQSFLNSKGLRESSAITITEAVSDLEARWGTVKSEESPRFRRGLYGKVTGDYQRLFRTDREGNQINEGALADSHRFANHASTTIDRFRRILECRRGVQLSKADRERLGISKHATTPLAPDQPCHTLTTLPDDYLHYLEPRILTVREYGRLQSFPDWFEFRGKYTTGGKERKSQCPRYTQAGNAVPPLVSEILGLALKEYIARALYTNPIVNWEQA